MNAKELQDIIESDCPMDNQDCKIYCIELNQKGDLILKYANKTFLSVFDLEPNVLGKTISSIFDKTLTRMITEKFYFYYQQNEPITLLNLAEKTLFSEVAGNWSYCIKFKNNIMICVGRKLQAERANNFSKLTSIYEFKNSNYLFFSVVKKKQHYYYSSDDVTLLKALNQKTLVGKSLDLFETLSYRANLFSVLDSCLYNQRIIEYLDSDGVNYFKIRLIPSKQKRKEVHILVVYITKEEYEKEKFSQYASNIFLPVESRYASCTILNEKGHKHLEIANKYFYEILEEFQINIDDILATKEFKLTSEEGIYTKATYYLPNMYGLKRPLLLSYIPINTNTTSMQKILFIGTIPENHKYDSQLEEILTKREFEVATSVAQNETNKYIAYKLNITEGTVKRTVYNIYQKLGVSSRVELTKLLYSCINEQKESIK